MTFLWCLVCISPILRNLFQQYKYQKLNTSNFLLMDICSVRNFNRLDYDSCDFKQHFKPIRTIDLLKIITRLYWLQFLHNLDSFARHHSKSSIGKNQLEKEKKNTRPGLDRLFYFFETGEKRFDSSTGHHHSPMHWYFLLALFSLWKRTYRSDCI